MVADIFRPTTMADLGELIRSVASNAQPIELRGGGSKRDIGTPDRAATIIEMSGFAGVIDYDPNELVLTVGAGTSLADVEHLVAAQGQMLAFEPFDHGPLFGRPAGLATIGGVVAAGVSGSRRLSGGAVRDHLLGFEAVSGRGEAFVGGGRVVKNVTGYDLPKLMAGSRGRLAALTSVTLNVLPRPRMRATLVVRGLGDEAAIDTMARAMGSPAEVAAAAHLPAEGMTLLRIEGFEPSVAARALMLQALLGEAELWSDGADDALWTTIVRVAPLSGPDPLWRISVAPSRGPAIYRALAPLGARCIYDWAGGLVWLTLPAQTEQHAVRRAAAAQGGHAMLVRAPVDLRAQIAALHPEDAGLAALSARVRAGFDPAGILSPDRFGGLDAH